MKNVENEATGLLAGAATTNITPLKPCFLFGYPFVERISTGVNDCLLSSALYLFDGENHSLFISNDVIFISKASAERVRTKISERTGIPASSVMIAATHTHSGPVTLDYISSSNDPVVPKVDDEYVRYMEDKSIEAACLAYQNACPAKAGFLVADGTGVGTNRHDPAGPADMDVPVVVLKNLNDKMIGCMLVCHMHPTILHEDSTLVSSDFPAYVRDVLQKEYFGCECPVVYFTGAAGNQSPRHVTRENTFAEAHRIGKIVADAIGRKINTGLDYLSDVSVACSQTFVDLPKRQFPDVKKAEKHRDEFLERFERLRKTSGNTQEIRTAEVDWFGAEELFYLSKLAEKGALEQVYTSCLPAEIQIFKIGDWCFVAWPGEIFIEYAKTLKKIVKNTFLITLANGELQGYIATEEAENNGFYEASNSIFHYASGKILVDETVRLINTKA